MEKKLFNSLLVCPDMDKEYPAIVRGSGIYLYDSKGKEYIDASGCSAAVSNIGHGNEEVGNIILEQTKKINLFPTHEFCSLEVESYFNQLTAFAPPGFTKVWTATSGTEAVEQSVKLAIQYHQIKGDRNKYKVISRWGSYHGNSVFMLDIGGMPLRRSVFEQLLHNFVHISPAYFYRSAYTNETDYCESLIEEVEQLIIAEGPDTIAALVAEPIVGAALGAVPPPERYFEQLRLICTKYNILLIVDEVMTGFGRTGKNFGIDNWNVIPDIMALGKGISSGYYPLSAVLVHENIVTAFRDSKAPFLGGHTYSCNPVGAVVGKYVLDYIGQNDLVKNAELMGNLLMEKFQKLYKYSIVGNIRGRGLLMGIEFVKDQITKEPFPVELNVSKRIGALTLEKGVVTYPGKGSVDGRTGDHLLLGPPLIINEQQVNIIADVVEQSIKILEESLSKVVG